MIRKLTIIFFIFFSINSLAGNGSIVGNGTGLLEIHFNNGFFALKDCLRTEGARKRLFTGAKELELSRAISQYVPTLPKLFISRDNKDGFFNIDGESKVAVTGLDKNTPIYINTDIALKNNSFQFSKKDVLSIIAHELGHHLGIQDHDYLSTFGSSVANFCRNKVSYSSQLITFSKNDAINLVVVNDKGSKIGLPTMDKTLSVVIATSKNTQYYFDIFPVLKDKIGKCKYEEMKNDIPSTPYLYFDPDPNFEFKTFGSPHDYKDLPLPSPGKSGVKLGLGANRSVSHLLIARKNCGYRSLVDLSYFQPQQTTYQFFELRVDYKVDMKNFDISLRRYSLKRYKDKP